MKILVVEDDIRIADTLKKGLMLENFVVDVAYNGTVGYDLAANEKYDVLVLDWMLPEKDGVQISRELRLLGNMTPILMLTAKTQTEDKVLGLNTGADDYLTKPFAFEELVARIYALARRPVETISEKLVSVDIELNVNKTEVRKRGVLIEISRKEFSLLEHLIRNKGQIISKEKIIDNVWDFESEVMPNTVEVTIANLRKKLGDQCIKTVRGFGYKME